MRPSGKSWGGAGIRKHQSNEPPAGSRACHDTSYAARLDVDLTQAELASRTGLNRRTILNAETGIGAFEFESRFIKSGIELSPIKMPLSKKKIYSFPETDNKTFKELPGMIADSLPDDFGNAIMNSGDT